MKTMTLQDFLNLLIDEIAEQKIPLTSEILVRSQDNMAYYLTTLEFIYDDEYGEIRFYLNEDD